MRLIVTGGAGFIGSALIRYLLRSGHHQLLNLDKLGYAGNRETIQDFDNEPNYEFEQTNICEFDKLKHFFNQFRPDGVIHLAAETHVDRSIDSPKEFIQSNIIGTYNLLEVSRTYVSDINSKFRFHHVSTDEVFGDLDEVDYFNESSPYQPSSPYSASKASSDHLVRAWYRTFKLPVLITNCSNNYGPYQYPEKFIPLMIMNALDKKPLPVYGDGLQVRDWLYVDDHVEALMKVFENGKTGETYNIGSRSEAKNIDLVKLICQILDKLKPDPHTSYDELIKFVPDRPGHDRRYAINPEKIETELDWKANETLESGLEKTVHWYLDNQDWCKSVLGKNYNRERLGLIES